MSADNPALATDSREKLQQVLKSLPTEQNQHSEHQVDQEINSEVLAHIKIPGFLTLH